MAKFVGSGKLSDLKPRIRRALTTLQGLLPDEALRSKEVAIALHTTTARNLVCRYHRRHYKVKTFDASAMYMVEGVAYPGNYNKTAQDSVKIPVGYMHCGCLIDDVLMDFFFWKTWTVKSTRKDLAGQVDTMKTDVLPPRIRAFVIEAFKSATMLEVDDLYGKYGRGKTLRDLDLRFISIQKLVNDWAFRTGVPITLNLPPPPQQKEEVVNDSDMI